jgi:hypothetical protein
MQFFFIKIYSIFGSSTKQLYLKVCVRIRASWLKFATAGIQSISLLVITIYGWRLLKRLNIPVFHDNKGYTFGGNKPFLLVMETEKDLNKDIRE